MMMQARAIKSQQMAIQVQNSTQMMTVQNGTQMTTAANPMSTDDMHQQGTQFDSLYSADNLFAKEESL